MKRWIVTLRISDFSSSTAKAAAMLAERPLGAADADDAAWDAAFGYWPSGARLCRVTNLDGQEVASIGRIPGSAASQQREGVFQKQKNGRREQHSI
jgi:hypothetical protein